jgi:hypothetical protein
VQKVGDDGIVVLTYRPREGEAEAQPA